MWEIRWIYVKLLIFEIKLIGDVVFVWGGGCKFLFLNYYLIMYKFRDVYKIKLIES